TPNRPRCAGGSNLSPAKPKTALLLRGRRQPFSREAGEGRAQHPLRARAKRAAAALSKPPGRKVNSPPPPPSRPVIRPPGPFSRNREPLYPHPPSLRRWIKPFSREAEDSPSPAKRETALLLRSGRRATPAAPSLRSRNVDVRIRRVPATPPW